MKVVLLERETNSTPYQVIQAIGYVAAIFSLIVCVLMIANNSSLKRSDPIHSSALTNLVTQLKANPGDAGLREQIRDLDYLARKAFFTSQNFNRTAILLLLGGLAVTVICFKSLQTFRAVPPYPNSGETKPDTVLDAAWARKSVTVAGLLLVGFALALALPWRSPLDTETSVAVSLPHSNAVQAPVTTAALSPKGESDWASLDERQRQWPEFLGAGGVLQGQKIPTNWNAETGAGIGWKTEIPLPGMNSPIVWKDRVFLSGANADSREVFCFATDSGKLIWRRALAPSGRPAGKKLEVSEDTGYAASTMVTDGRRAFAVFASGDLAAFDFEGNPLWGRNINVGENSYGYASSLALFENTVIVQMDRKSGGFIAGIDGATGKDVWKAERALASSWASPRVLQIEGAAQLLTVANPAFVSYDPRNGKELWRVECLKGAEVAVSPAFGDGVVYAAGENINLSAINVTTREVLWRNRETIPGISTPLVAKGHLFVGLSDGGIVCLNAKTGKEAWRAETDEGIFASPVRINDRVYFFDRGGTAHICKADGASYQNLGAPKVGEEVYATPAVTEKGLFVRGVHHLFLLRDE